MYLGRNAALWQTLAARTAQGEFLTFNNWFIAAGHLGVQCAGDIGFTAPLLIAEGTQPAGLYSNISSHHIHTHRNCLAAAVRRQPQGASRTSNRAAETHVIHHAEPPRIHHSLYRSKKTHASCLRELPLYQPGESCQLVSASAAFGAKHLPNASRAPRPSFLQQYTDIKCPNSVQVSQLGMCKQQTQPTCCW
jgi:hypothetical protein